jgi:hypothetical protein
MRGSAALSRKSKLRDRREPTRNLRSSMPTVFMFLAASKMAGLINSLEVEDTFDTGRASTHDV